MKLQLMALPGAEERADALASRLGAAYGVLDHRRFPDGETYLRVAGDVSGQTVAVVAALKDPDPQIPGLLFLADALRELGAPRVGLVAPYLPYMRQDARFRPGEAVTSCSFARLVSRAYDWLVTVDPHLHRHPSLRAIYDIPSRVLASAPAIADWVRASVERPALVGPDAESTQWVGEVARLVGCPHAVLSKQRHGDFDVDQSVPELAALRGRTPVLLDDIVSSGHSMAGAVRLLRGEGFDAPVCVAVHALFAPGAQTLLHNAGAARVVSCNTVAHPSNAIDLTPQLGDAVKAVCGAG
jgi:ribose-phosphate pyrophosphokinase